ncbi:GCN5-related N-acetyltransferase [metagenome]|uniref:GCN5-related N-acetyltransferase n=1 Tax=metagenome TaxID=256318 RepID=A0A2P2BXG0_9ZZZZ
MTSEASRFAPDPVALPAGVGGLPSHWTIGTPATGDIDRLVALRRAHELAGRGFSSTTAADVLVEVSGSGLDTRAHVVLRDHDGVLRAWAGVQDRAEGRMVFADVIDRDLSEETGAQCSALLVTWAERQAREVGGSRGLRVQQIDTGAFADDERQHRWLAASGFARVRTWWQMSRPVQAEESTLVPSPDRWERNGVTFRLIGHEDLDEPSEADLRTVHDVLEGAFADHFNSREETFEEFVQRLREDPGHRWDHWWLADLEGVGAVGALVGSQLPTVGGPDGSYVDYLGVLEQARGRGVAKGLLHTIIADAAARGRDRVGLEVDADSPTGAEGLYVAMGWRTSYVTESWHRDVAVD